MDEVAPGVFVATAELYTTTTTIVAGADGGCLVIDPAVTVADLAALASWLSARRLRPAVGWSTHPHWDHLLWSRVLGEVIRYGTPRAVAVAARRRSALAGEAAEMAPGHGAVFLPATGVLVAGDMCSDAEIPLLDRDAADPFGGYRHGLGVLAGLPGVRVVVPGHGRPGDAAEFRRRVAADFGYLDAVEAGREPADPRLAASWLRTEHDRQRALLLE